MRRRNKGAEGNGANTVAGEFVIVDSSDFPFFQKYHDGGYVLSHDRRPNVVLKDKGAARLYNLLNDLNKELVCYRVDGGLISSKDVSKCDFGIYSEDDLLVLVELKGADYNKALEQLLSTIDILLRNPSIPVSKVCTRVVLSRARVPDVLVTKEKKLKLMIEREYRGNHSKCTRQMDETLSNM